MPHILRADQVPTPAAATTFLDPSSLTPTVSPVLAAGDTTRLLSVVNEIAARVDAGGRAIGAYAVSFGLTISAASGLHLTIAAGQAVMDSVVTVPTNLDVVLPDNTLRVFVWLSQAGAPSLVSNSTASPGTGFICLGSAVTAAAAISSVDDSGVMRLCGSTLFRATFDSSCPVDTPPSIAFYTVGVGGVWLWDCTAYQLVQGGRAALTYSSDATKTLSAAEYSNSFLDFLASGTSLGATRDCILPLHAGRAWDVRNLSPGAQSIRFIGSSGAGITVANGKACRIVCSGTDIVRVTADSP